MNFDLKGLQPAAGHASPVYSISSIFNVHDSCQRFKVSK